VYYLFFALFLLLSLLPLRVLYFLSGGICFLLYHLLGYRKKVVRDNLARAFPEKSEAQRTALAKTFYRNLSDMTVEIVKLMSVSRRSLERRFSGDLGLLHELQASGRTIQIHLGHYFNWEWANLYIRLQMAGPFLVVYKPLSNRAFERLLRYIRSRFGSVMIPSDDIQAAMRPWQGAPYTTALVADQNPGRVRRALWLPFMHRMTPFFKGPEISARRADAAVVFGRISKVGRGRYHITVTLLADHPRHMKEGGVTEAFASLLEEAIREQPENWVWSHRRWKYTWQGETAAGQGHG
jgi:KDO2-lipid IV(A) lauroyltransferase